MKRREIFLVIIIIIFGLLYESSESGDIDLFEGCHISPRKLLDRAYKNTFKVEQNKFEDLKFIKIENPGGEIEVETSLDNTTEIKPVIYVYHKNKKKAEAIYKKSKISYKLRNNRLKVEMDSRWRFPYRRVRIHFKVLTSKEVELDLNNSYGGVSVKSINSDIKIKNRHGNLTLQDVKGEADLNLSHSKFVDIKNVSSLKIRCSHSKFLIENIENETYITRASHCSIKMENGKEFNLDGGYTKIQLKNMKNNINIKNSHELVQLEDITGDIRVMARHCRVKLKNTVSDYLIIKNTYRHIDIKNISGKNVDIFITHGDLSLTFDKIEERINIKNRHSDIIMNYSKSVNPSFNINTSYGKIINRTATEFNILKEKHKLSLFTMEDTPEIIINNTYGNILLKNYD